MSDMNQSIARLLLAACALAFAGGCISLFPMPGTGKKKSGPPAKAEVDGKVFGTGTMVVDEWGVTLLVDPASVDVINTPEQLVISSAKGGVVDPIHGGFELTMRPKKPGETAQTLIAEELRKLNVKRKPQYFTGVMASFDIPAIEDQTSNGSFIGSIKAAEQGRCVFELLIVAPDIDQLVRLELATRAGILSKVGKTPMPPSCQ